MNFLKNVAILLSASVALTFYSCSASSNGSKVNVASDETTTEKTIVKDSKEVINDEVFKAVDLTETTFNEAISSGIVLVDFWAVWCPPCRVQGPIIDDLAKEVGSWAKIAKVDVDRNGGVASTYNIQNIPTLLLFKDGKLVRRYVGVQQKETLLNALNELK
ncbi:MAG: thioredoxin [Desulfobulbaceae bacterium]|nr:thioredoxin [Desulfobulbaceae bacterium]